MTLAAVALAIALCGQVEVLHIGAWKPMSPRADQAIKLAMSGFRAKYKDVPVALLLNDAADAIGLIRRWCGNRRSWRPQLVVASDLWLPEMFDELEPLPKPVAERLKQHAPASIVQRMSRNGRVYGVPCWIEPRVLFYWPQYIKERKWRPASWYEVLEKAQEAVRKRNVWGVGVPGGGMDLARLFLEVVWGLGGDLRGKGGNVDFMSTHAEQALDLLVQADRKGLTEPQSLSWSQEELEEAFVQRKIACLVAGASLEEQLEGKRYAVAPLPGPKPFVSAEVDCMVAFAGGKQTSQALKFLEFLASPEGQSCIAQSNGLSFYPDMARKTATTPALKAAAEGLANVRTMPQIHWTTIVAAIERAYYMAVSGRHSVSWALEEAQATYDRAAQEARW